MCSMLNTGCVIEYYSTYPRYQWHVVHVVQCLARACLVRLSCSSTNAKARA